MKLFWFKKSKPVVIETPKEVTDSRAKLEKASRAVSQNTQKINRVLTKDHVTLRIHTAIGGK